MIDFGAGDYVGAYLFDDDASVPSIPGLDDVPELADADDPTGTTDDRDEMAALEAALRDDAPAPGDNSVDLEILNALVESPLHARRGGDGLDLSAGGLDVDRVPARAEINHWRHKTMFHF